jgi:acetyltransferase-like isoleucine patch superfamily enzyme
MIKLLAHALGLGFRFLECMLALPTAVLFIILGRLAVLCDRYAEVSLIVSKIPLRFGEYVRYLYYKFTLNKLGNNVVFKYGCFCQYNNARIGSEVLIGYYTALGEVDIGDGVVIGGFVNFLSGTTQHSFADPSKPICSQEAPGRKMISIGTDVWIGSNAVIAANVGHRCVIGAGCVLVREAESNSIYVGNPARLVKNIPSNSP